MSHYIQNDVMSLRKKESGAFLAPMGIAVPPLEIDFIHYELTTELSELCKRVPAE
ncbi:MAG: hypothetical protein KUG78_14150 [Kangiellaceae bacterium]|nr:hypothetical protein [Kangiellaceae bacterium]